VALLVHHVSSDHATLNTLWSQILGALQTPAARPDPVDYPSIARDLSAAQGRGAESYLRAMPPSAPAPLAAVQGSQDGPAGRFITQNVAALTAQQVKSAARGPVAPLALAASAMAARTALDGDTVDLALVTSLTETHRAALVGCTTNSVPVWMRCAPEDTASSVTARAAEVFLSVWPYRHLPYAQIVEAAHKRGAGFDPARFLVAVIDKETSQFGGAPVDERHVPSRSSVAPICFFLIFDGDAVEVGIEYDRRIFGDPFAQGALACFAQSLTSAVTAQDDTLRAIAQTAHRASVLTGPDLAQLPGVLPQIVSHLKRGASTPAVLDETGAALSWAALSGRVTALAAHLESLGIGPGARVAIAVPRSADYIAMILAVLARRAAYIPVDLSYPQERIGQILQGAAPDLCLTTPGNCADPVWRARGIALDDGAAPEQPASAGSILTPQPGDIAYIIFTSGSTGAPTGVPITHAQLDHSTNARPQTYGAAPTRFGLMSSLAFDSSLVGLFWTLSQGGALVLPSQSALRDPRQLAGLAQLDLSHTLLVPTLYDALLDLGDRPLADTVMLAGEGVPDALVHRHFQAAPQTDLINEYGLTEASVWSLWHRLTAADPRVRLGAPAPGCWAAVVDDADMPCPAGVAGHLIVGGPMVAQGYLEAPQKTAEKFFDADAPGLPGGPALRTGDRAVLDGDALVYLGRSDRQA